MMIMRRFDISDSSGETDAITLVDQILHTALLRGASDVHIEPTAEGTEVRLRIDGLLETHSRYTAEVGRSLVTRLMVMAQLLTYRQDIPQEGRLRASVGKDSQLELRLAIMPTTHGLRAAVRMPAELIQPRTLDELGLPPAVIAGLKDFARGDSGMLLVTGPAGSGKTTTIYALLEHIARVSPGLSLVSLEDPVERDIPGVTQIEVSPFGQLTYERALRSILRQDPQVMMLGEIRDAQTASLAAQAALSGHRLICTLHAATPGGAIARLLEMGLEPYRITSALYGVIAQRLLRRRNTSGKPGRYRGRIPAAEFVPLTAHLRAAILTGADAVEIQQVAAKEDDYSSLRDSADSLGAQNLTDEQEVARVLGASERETR
jgi:type II secretory ATPase GspE/PulE/Tfp pilus assembly ATPase PilB-like protein